MMRYERIPQYIQSLDCDNFEILDSLSNNEDCQVVEGMGEETMYWRNLKRSKQRYLGRRKHVDQ